MQVEITSLYSKNGGEEIVITFALTSDDGQNTERQSFTLSSKQYLILSPAKGESDTDTFDAVASAAQVWQATKRGIYILGYGACSEKALLSKLIAKGFERHIAREAVDELVARGLIRAADDASREAQRQAAKLWGRSRIVSALYEKGYSAEAVNAALDSLEDAGIDYVKNCRALISKKYRDLPSDPKERSKMIAALARHGYSMSEIKQALL